MNENKINKNKINKKIKSLPIKNLFQFTTSVKRIEIIKVIKNSLPATSKFLEAKLHLLFNFMRYRTKEELDSLIVLELVKVRNEIITSTPQFDSYVKELSANVENYRKEHNSYVEAVF